MLYFKRRGGAGIVVDGRIRDAARVRRLGVPIWCTGTTPHYASQTDLFPWAYDVPVAAGGDVGGADLTGLAGIRHSVISEPPGWLRRPRVREGIARYARTGLALELLVAARDLGDVRACAEEHPALTIVVDHLGNPTGGGAAWQAGVRALAPYPDVRMKLSGDGVTAAAFEVVLEALGPERLMIGSDASRSTSAQSTGEEKSAVARICSRAPFR